MALNIVREVGRSLGFSLASGKTIIQGQPLMIASNGTSLQPYDHSITSSVPYGLALEDSTVPPLADASGLTAGQGYDYTNFARGGVYSVLCDGGEVDLFNGGSGAPFVTTDTYTIGAPLYCGSSGLVTASSSSAALVGYCVNFSGANGSAVTNVRMKLAV
jgi:hypothetical protein